MARRRPEPPPTPEQIAERCAEVRREWGEHEEARRRGCRIHIAYEIPTDVRMEAPLQRFVRPVYWRFDE